MPSTPLHAALGDTSGALTMDLVERACLDKVAERADLDWKSQLPLTADDPGGRDRQKDELAKDIAAMANSGGGMIVFGVAETRTEGTSAAERVVPVGPVDELTLRGIRLVASSLIYPPVTGLDLYPLAPVEAPDDGVLVLLVPDSPDAPHLILSKNREWLRAPYRHGPDTQWMVERQISDAYRNREQGRRRRLEDFDDRFRRFTDSLGGRPDASWVIMMAVPDTPLRRPRDLRQEQAQRIIDSAWIWEGPRGMAWGPMMLTRGAVTRRGLQRYYRTGEQPIPKYSATPRARVEVHGDGSVAVALTRDGAFGDGHPGQVAIPDIEQTGRELFTLLWSTHTNLSVTGDYTARITVSPGTEEFRRPDSIVSDFTPFDESHRVLGYQPVDGPIITEGGLEGALESWLDLVRDAVNQAGARSTLDAQDLMTALHLSD